MPLMIYMLVKLLKLVCFLLKRGWSLNSNTTTSKLIMSILVRWTGHSVTATFIVCLKYSCLRTALILQVVLAPVLVGAWMQTFFPQVVATITHVAPLIAVLVSSLLASRWHPLSILLQSIYCMHNYTCKTRPWFLMQVVFEQLGSNVDGS